VLQPAVTRVGQVTADQIVLDVYSITGGELQENRRLLAEPGRGVWTTKDTK